MPIILSFYKFFNNIKTRFFILLFCSCNSLYLVAQNDEVAPHHKVLVRTFEQKKQPAQQLDTLPPTPLHDGSSSTFPRFKETPNGKLYYKAEKMPYFGDCTGLVDESSRVNCSEENFVRYAQQSLKYPQEAIDAGIQGVIMVEFVIETDGRVTNTRLLRDLGYGCGEEALRMIKTMPSWVAGSEGGAPVRVSLSLPIVFSLPSGSTTGYRVSWGSIQTNIVSHIDLLFNMNEPVFVRDRYGNEMPITMLSFAYQRGKTLVTEKSSGFINERMQRIIRKKVKPKGIILLGLTIQSEGQEVQLEKQIAIKKN